MLAKMRSAHDTIWAKILMGLLIFSFVGWGVAGWIFGDQATDDSIISVGGDKVRIAEYESEKNRQLANMERAMKREIYSDKQVGFYFSQQILSNLASRLMLDRRADDLGLGVSRQAIAAMIRNAPEFQENGFFSTDKFDAVLSLNGITEEGFVDILRRQLLREMVLTGITEGLSAPDFMTNVLYNMRYESRRIDYAAIKYDDYSAGGKPTEEDLRRVYASSKQIVPEFRAISYAKVQVGDMENPDEFDKAFARVQKLEDALIGGDSLVDAAARVGAKIVSLEPITIQKKTAGDKDIGDPVITENLVNELFGLEEGGDTSAVELKDGFAIARVMKVEPAHAVPFENMEKELTALWVEEQKEQKAYLSANTLLKELNENSEASFRNAANKAGVRNLQLNANITRSMTSVFPEEVLNRAFSAAQGENVLIAGRRAFYIASVRGMTAPKPNAEQMTSIKTDGDAMLSKMVLDDYTGFLARQYPVKTNTRVFNRLFNMNE
ncbi:MAG: SurA N-terminal domain-containing protein [Rickettsiales bacterium]|jgi:peptidyl-prolyl cis-trans isomerase D|nr:SurA N-terminal domain-containing protein [Rickettsiales bacterium]